jgi:hypothetical protein
MLMSIFFGSSVAAQGTFRPGSEGASVSAVLPVPAAMMTTVTTMAAVHENVHQWACSQEDPRQERKNVSAVLGDEKKRSNDREGGERPFRPGTPGVTAELSLLGHD